MTRAALVFLLLVSATSLHIHDVREYDNCACLEWRSVYETQGVKCGQGYELGSLHKPYQTTLLDPGTLPDVGLDLATLSYRERGMKDYNRLCPFFHMKLEFDKCLNKKFGAQVEQWCYVDSKCEKVDSRVPGTNVSIRTCEEGDFLMSKVRPEELNSLADNSGGVDAGLLGKLSYPMAAAKWSDVEAVSGLSPEALKISHTYEDRTNTAGGNITLVPKKASVEMAATLQAAKMSGKATIFDCEVPLSNCGGTLVWGEGIWAFTSLELNPFGRLGYKCVSDTNCAPANSRD